MGGRMNTFGPILAQKRKEKHLSQGDVAEMLTGKGYDAKPYIISKWEKDVNLPNVLQFFALCEILDINNINSTFHISGDNTLYSKLNDDGQNKADEYMDLLVRSGLYVRETAEIIPFHRTIKLYDLPVSAGTGQFLDSDYFREIEVGHEVSRYADFGVRISGDSMEPQFVNGQTIWIHQQNTLENGEIGIFYYDGQAYCKKFEQSAEGIFLISLNTNYAPIAIPEESDFKIFGKVVG